MLAFALLLLSATPAVDDRSDIVVVARARHPVLAGAIVGDAQLARMRGGLALPNGLNVVIGIDIQTRIDGVLALHTIFNSDGPNAGVSVYTDGTDSPRVAPGTAVIETGGNGGSAVVTIDRSPAGTVITSTQPVPAATVNLVNGDQSTWLMAEGQTRVPVTTNGAAVYAAPGRITLTNDGSGPVVTLDVPLLQVRQLIGQATGAVIANTGNDRTIDTASSVNVDLQGLSPALMAGIFDAQRAVFDAMAR